MIRLLSKIVLILFLAQAATASTVQQEKKTDESKLTFDFGFIASRLYDVNGDLRLKVLGPLFEHAYGDQGKKMRAYRPLYSHLEDPARDRKDSDYVWPLWTTRSIHDEGRWRCLFFYGFNHSYDEPDNRYRYWLLPFYFQSRGNDGKTHRALFPLGGTIKDFLFQDSISFTLWPLYVKSQVNDVKTTGFLWPLLSKSTTPDNHIYRSRFFPFYGVSKHKGKYQKKFVLWPFYTSAKYEYKNSQGGGHILFPLYGYMNLNTEKTIWAIPPFFRYTKGDKRNIIYAPWPFYQRVTGEGIYKHYIWPLWGHRKIEGRERNFYLWPIFWTDKDKRPGTTSKRFIAAPFFSHTSVRADMPMSTDDKSGPVIERRHKLWPIYSYRRNGDASRFRFIELWPFADASVVERNLAPFWSIYTRYASGDRVDSELLWGLYRHNRRADQERYWSLFPLFDYKRDTQVDQPVRKWNILKGLIGYEHKGSEKSIRLLYFIKFGIGKED